MRDGHAYVVASDGQGGRRADTLGAAPAALREAGVPRLRGARLTDANPRFLLRHGIPALPQERAATLVAGCERR